MLERVMDIVAPHGAAGRVGASRQPGAGGLMAAIAASGLGVILLAGACHGQSRTPGETIVAPGQTTATGDSMVFQTSPCAEKKPFYSSKLDPHP